MQKNIRETEGRKKLWKYLFEISENKRDICIRLVTLSRLNSTLISIKKFKNILASTLYATVKCEVCDSWTGKKGKIKSNKKKSMFIQFLLHFAIIKCEKVNHSLSPQLCGFLLYIFMRKLHNGKQSGKLKGNKVDFTHLKLHSRTHHLIWQFMNPS